MTMLDDDLTRLFTEAAAALRPPTTGAGDILAKASGGPLDRIEDDAQPAEQSPHRDELGWARARRLARTLKAHRLVSGVAAVVVALALAGGASWLGSPAQKPSGTLASGTHASAKPAVGSAGGGAVTTTTVPSRLPSPGPLASALTSPGAGAAIPASPNAASAAPSTATGGAPPSASVPQSVGQPARIEQTGSLSLTVPKGSLGKTMTQLHFLAGASGGFVANSTTQSGPVADNGAPSGSITLEVPVASFSDVLKKAQALGKTVSLTTKATDVTAHYVDLQSQIAALQASRQQYLTIMAKATSIGDVLAVQAQLDSIDSQIQQLQGQLQTAREAFAFLSGLDAATPLRDTEPLPGRLEPLADYLARIELRPDVKAAQQRITAAQENISAARGAYYPSVDLNGNYYLDRTGETRDKDVDWDVQLALTLPLYAGGVRQSRVREAASQRAQAELAASQTSRQAEQEIRALYQGVVFNQSQVEALAAATDTARRNYEIQAREYRLGLVTNLDVLQALTAYQENQRALDRARYAAKLNYITLQAAALKRPGLREGAVP